MLLVDSRSRTMPTELWLHVLSFCGCDWFQASDEAAAVGAKEIKGGEGVGEARSGKRRKIGSIVAGI